jgi:GH24 family phage-related lysozyme (muramidase)
MNASQFCVDLIKQCEGFCNKAYKPVSTEKYWTIGYGHYGSDVKQGQVITKEQGEILLKKDLEKFIHGVVTLLKVYVNQNQFDALVSFSYNLGLGCLEKSDLLEFVNKKDFTNASKEFSKFIHGGGKILPGLVKRRELERQLFLKAMPTPIKPKVDVVKPQPKAPQPVYYTVVKGDAVFKIATKFGSTAAQIKAWNKLDSQYKIIVGQKLRVK